MRAGHSTGSCTSWARASTTTAGPSAPISCTRSPQLVWLVLMVAALLYGVREAFSAADASLHLIALQLVLLVGALVLARRGIAAVRTSRAARRRPRAGAARHRRRAHLSAELSHP
ncbi:hypothetical protein, partial [Eggerthella sinensis]|uniref:hypothetical protein n=1 Tax=Eggerthella sinensis TaxID=242230 RepID=UPI0022E83183